MILRMMHVVPRRTPGLEDIFEARWKDFPSEGPPALSPIDRLSEIAIVQIDKRFLLHLLATEV